MHATALSQQIPTGFFIDVLHSVANVVFHKTYHVKMGRWKSKSRLWWVGTANVGEGKSTGMKHLANIMVQVLTENSTKAADRFRFQQSGTKASAIDKFRWCEAPRRNTLPQSCYSDWWQNRRKRLFSRTGGVKRCQRKLWGSPNQS